MSVDLGHEFFKVALMKQGVPRSVALSGGRWALWRRGSRMPYTLPISALNCQLWLPLGPHRLFV